MKTPATRKEPATSEATPKPKSRKKQTRASAASKATTKEADIGDEAVVKATGKRWEDWFRLLDRAGAKELDHRGIVAILVSTYDVQPWWSQMLTVGYERARGLRAKHERPDGDWSVSGNKTVAAPIAAVYAAWSDAKQRKKWLADPGFTVRTETENKSMRITWVDGKSHVDAMFYVKGDAKTQVQVEHRKLADAKSADKMKAYWKKELGKMAEMVEG